MSIENVLLRPSLRFIATLPTLKLRESIWVDTVEWEVNLGKPVMIMCRGYPILDKFYIGAKTLKNITWTGWRYDLKICLYTSYGEVLIDYVDEDFYLHRKWWNPIATVE